MSVAKKRGKRFGDTCVCWWYDYIKECGSPQDSDKGNGNLHKHFGTLEVEISSPFFFGRSFLIRLTAARLRPDDKVKIAVKILTFCRTPVYMYKGLNPIRTNFLLQNDRVTN